MMKDCCRMVFPSGTSVASASINTCECVRPNSPTPGLEFHSSIGPHPSASNKKTETTILANLPCLALIIPFLSLHFLPSHSSSSLYFLFELLCLPRCVPWPALRYEPLVFSEPESPQCNVLLVKMRHGSQATGMLLFPQTAYQLP